MSGLPDIKEAIRRGLELTEDQANAALARLQLVILAGDLTPASPQVTRSSYISGGLQTAVAAEYAMWQLWNPATSGKLLVVTKVLASCNGTLRVGETTTENPATGSVKAFVPTDLRRPNLVGAAAITYYGTAGALVGGAAIGTQLSMPTTTALDNVVSPRAFKIVPGYSLLLQHEVVNQALYTTFYWEEEPYFPES